MIKWLFCRQIFENAETLTVHHALLTLNCVRKQCRKEVYA